ncbi:MAG: EamA family transporter RarD [Anaerolineales bacterium]|nr:EamA family transporter RarD [Anaerolineales bacterium]
MRSINKGIWAGIGAYGMWGLFPLYWKLLESVPALEILGHRMVWSLLFLAVLLTWRQDWGWLSAAARNRRVLIIYSLAAALLSVNWGVYIWGVNAGYIVETSLGYFINPLVNVIFGVLFLGERLRRGQAVAVTLAAVGVIYLTFNYGRLPWVALILALSFALYGLLKKTASLNAVHSLTLETIVMFLPAFGYLIYRQIVGVGAFAHQGFATTSLLALAGLVTSIPLLLFGMAARRIPLSMIGFLQYIAPTLQFLIGIFIFNEPFPPARLVGFAIIWAALAVYSAEGLWNGRKNGRS